MGVEAVPLTARVIVRAAALCRRFEGFRARPYLCPAGVWTIGYGSTRYEDGRAVQPSDPAISQERAEELLQLELARSLAQLLATSPGLTSAPEGVLAALLDFVYNLGIGRYRASTLRRKAEAFDWTAAAAELLKWVNGGGRRLAGLVARREAEVELLPA